jgi:hypothetical protein
MKLLVPVGILLILIGLAGVVFGGIPYSKKRSTTDLGPVSLTVQEKGSLPIHPAVGVVVALCGVVVTGAGVRKP